MSTKDSAIEMIRAAQRGHKESWNLVYAQFYTRLYAIAIQRCRSLATAEDAVQDTFIIAYLKLSQLQEPAAFPGWIKKILLNTCFKTCGYENRHQSIDSHLVDNMLRIEDELENKHDWLATKNALYGGLATLPEKLRSTLLLRYFFSFQSYEEIASILGIPMGTVRSRLNQAKLKLKEQWRSSTGENMDAISEVESWNSFYLETLSGIHHEDRYRDRFLSHFSKNAKLLSAGSDSAADSTFFKKMIQDDRRAGSWLAPANVMTSGNLSIIESRHFNSSKNPGHCPDMSVMIIERRGDKASKMRLHVL